MAADVKIRTELTLDSKGSESGLDALKSKFGALDGERSKAQAGFGDWSRTAHDVLAVVGTNLSQIVDRVRATGAAFIDAGSAAESGDQAIAALISSAQGKNFDESIRAAEDLGDRLDDVAIKAGVSGQALGDAYQVVVERTGASAEGIAKATAASQSLAVVSAKLGKDVGAITSEYSLMGEGILRTKGQLFQLLQSTGIFGDKTKGAAEQWGKLTEEKRAELLDYGLQRLSGQMAKMPATFRQAEASFENMVRIGKEEIGQPLIEELTPAFQDATKELRAMRPDIQELGKLLAREVGAGIREGGRMMREALSWIREHKGEIAADIKAAADAVTGAFKFVLAHKAEIAIAFGAGALLKAGPGGVAGFGGAIASGAGAVAGAVPGALKNADVFMNKLPAALYSSGPLLIAFSAAIVGVGLAAWQASKLLDDLDDAYDTQLGGLKKLQEAAEEGNLAKVEDSAKIMSSLDAAAGRMNPKLQEFYNSVVRLAEAKQLARADDAAMLQRQIELGRRSSEQAFGMQQGGDVGAAQNQAANSVAILINAYNQATQQGNSAMALMAAQTIGQSALLKDAFLKSSTEIEGGIDAMASMLMASGGSFGSFATQLRSKAATPPAPKISMPGARIEIKQDFRRADPDAVAITFRRLGREVDRRAGARYPGIFG